MTHGERRERELRNDFDRAHENSDISVTCRGCFSRDNFFFFFFYNSRISRSNTEQYREPFYTVRRNGNTIICIRSPGISGQINPRKKSQIHRPPLTERFFVLAISIPVEHSLPRSIHNRFTGKQFLGRKDDRFPGPEAGHEFATHAGTMKWN